MGSKKYNPSEIEPKWQKSWAEKKIYKCEVDKSLPKYYVLDMFPYPSGSGLHVGHVVGYAGSDVISRYKRMKGFNVLHPMGWDSFGLPAEQYAIRTGTHPQITTEANVKTYKRQLQSLGFSYDWDREFLTSDPKYYKWTQWIFTKLYEKGLAYEAEVMVNFCPALGTVLANEEIEDGKSVIGGHPVEKKPLKQWMFKITEYAERLLEDLDTLDWPDHLKKLQRNWIGKSKGININFSLKDDAKETITCYSTRPDTIFAVSFLVLAPEHPLVDKITTKAYRSSVKAYKKESASKSDLQRTELEKDKTGVFTGAYVENPITGESIPVWVADYVIMTYGTGAVMGVPCDDPRDKIFAQKYDIEIPTCFDEESNYINSHHEEVDLTGKKVEEAIEITCTALEKRGKGKRVVNYKLRDWLFSRQRYWGEPFPILHFEDGSSRTLGIDELPLTPPLIEDYLPSKEGKSPLSKVKSWVEIEDPKTGRRAFRETNTMPQWAGSCWYYLRFCDPFNEVEAWDKGIESYWMPVDLYIGGVEHAVLHLLYARFWHKVLFDLGLVSTNEPFQKLVNQGLVTSRSYKMKSGAYLRPEDVEEREDGKYINRVDGSVLTSQIEKMSKSKLNGVTPDEMIEEFGADALRLYELFMTPFCREKVWQTDAVSGCRRFLNRVFDLVQSEKIVESESEEANRLIHKLIKDVEEDFENLSFNTAIAKMMEFLNDFSSCKSYPKSAVKSFIQLIYPFAPHFGEECWEMLGESDTIVFHPFPTYEEKYLSDDKVTIVFQVNGKVRGSADFPKGISKEDILMHAKNTPNVAKFLTGNILKEIYVPNKLLNLVVR